MGYDEILAELRRSKFVRKKRRVARRPPVISESQRQLPKMTLAQDLEAMERDVSKRVYRPGEVDE